MRILRAYRYADLGLGKSSTIFFHSKDKHSNTDTYTTGIHRYRYTLQPTVDSKINYRVRGFKQGCGSDRFNTDPDPAFLLNADPDPAFLLNPDPDLISDPVPDPS
jgi:hypothetical protein